MRDGRQTGTGGGSHIVVGGATPAESPFLRRPDLLKSIMLYWQRHPSLSYLFSGLFIGPTSQSPRVDEARHEALYELEIALAQVPKAGDERAAVAARPPVPQSAGRRHRQHASRRDLRRQAVLAGFSRWAASASSNSAPSRWRRTRAWSLAQQLLVRALIAWFAREPQDGACVRWGTALHDRFMLPHFVWEDFLGVLSDLERAGYRFDPAWFDSAARVSLSRFTARSSTTACGSNCATHWSRGTCSARKPSAARPRARRIPPSSACRCASQGFNPARHVVACNGRRVPLVVHRPFGRIRRGCALQGWMLPVSLHPNLPVQRAAHLRHHRHVEHAVRSAAASITCTHPGGMR